MNPPVLDDAGRRLVQQTFAAHGVEGTLEADHLAASDGRRFGLRNLAVAWAATEADDRERLVREHVALLLAPESDASRLDAEALAEATYLRLVESAAVPGDRSRSVREFVPGVLQVLSVDLPTSVSTPPDEFWTPHGGADRWRDVGLRNLRALLEDDQLEHQVLSEGDVRFSLLSGPSFFTASLAMHLTDVLAVRGGEADAGHGVLVSFPNRHQLVWRVVDGPAVVPSLNPLIHFTLGGFDRGAGPLSPHLYWVHRGVWRQLTQRQGEQVRVDVPPELGTALGQR